MGEQPVAAAENQAVIEPRRGKREELLPSRAILAFTPQDVELVQHQTPQLRQGPQGIYLTKLFVGSCRGVPLVLAGHMPAAWGTPRFPDLPAYAEELGLTPYVRWIGPVREEDKAALYRLASVFVFPSLLEGFGLGPLEAMGSGTPVVACEASSIPEVAGDAAFLVAPGDSRAMGGAILSLLTQPEHAATMRNRGLARASDFSWRATAEGTLAAYEQVIRAR